MFGDVRRDSPVLKLTTKYSRSRQTKSFTPSPPSESAAHCGGWRVEVGGSCECCGPASGLLASPPRQSEEMSFCPLPGSQHPLLPGTGPSSEDPFLKLVPASLHTGMFLAV